MKINSYFIPPSQDEIEISIFGPGYGESIVIHAGANKWILADSCINKKSDIPTPIKYLHDIQIDIKNAVKLLASTHWHDDHVRGISKILTECESASFIMSKALGVKEFLKFVSLYKNDPVTQSSGLDEMAKVIQILEQRKLSDSQSPIVKLAAMDRLLFQEVIKINEKNVEIKVTSLSPSDGTELKSLEILRKLFEGLENKKKVIPSSNPNHTSVVLWIEVGANKILLGADLEKTNDSNTGWSVILSDSTTVNGQANFYKIPHHGSENAHSDEVWSNLFIDDIFCALTPYNRGKKPLPSFEDIDRIIECTPNAFATAPTRIKKHKFKESVVNKSVRRSTRRVSSTLGGWGHIRMRKKINDGSNTWQIEMFGDAYKLSAN